MNDLRTGDHILFANEFPCRLREIKKSAPGKHGHAKYSLKGTDLLCGKTRTMVCTHHDHPHYVTVNRRNLYCTYFEDDHAYTIDDGGNEESFRVKDNLLAEAEKYPDGCDIVVMDIEYNIKDKCYEHNVVLEFKE
jgi:translation elongation factor P/translation initiation factor 5A